MYIPFHGIHHEISLPFVVESPASEREKSVINQSIQTDSRNHTSLEALGPKTAELSMANFLEAVPTRIKTSEVDLFC